MKTVIHIIYFLHSFAFLSAQQAKTVTTHLFFVKPFPQVANVHPLPLSPQARLPFYSNWTHAPGHPLYTYLNPGIISNHSYNSVLIHARRELKLRQRFHEEDLKFDKISQFTRKLKKQINNSKLTLGTTIRDKKDDFTKTFAKLQKFLSKVERKLHQVDGEIQRTGNTVQMHHLNFQQDVKEIQKDIKPIVKELMEQGKDIGLASGAIGMLAALNPFGTQETAQQVIDSLGKRQYEVKEDESSNSGGSLGGMLDGFGSQNSPTEDLDSMVKGMMKSIPEVKKLKNNSTSPGSDSESDNNGKGTKVKETDVLTSNTNSTSENQKHTKNKTNISNSTFIEKRVNFTENGKMDLQPNFAPEFEVRNGTKNETVIVSNSSVEANVNGTETEEEKPDIQNSTSGPDQKW